MKYRTIIMSVAGCASSLFLSSPAAAQCRDPWISQAIREVTGRAPNGSGESGECRYTQYGGGQWGSYAQLKGYVQNALGGSFRGALSGTYNAPAGQVRVPRGDVTQFRSFNGRQQFQFQGRWFNLIGTDGATLIGTDGAT
jgi:hypothetical protein